MNTNLELMAYAAVQQLAAAKLTIATAESCTGGLIAAALTEVPGASAVFRYGWVTYCNEAKERILYVPEALMAAHTVVSEPVVGAMAESAMRQSGADIAVAVSGNAGPTAAAGEPPVGTVCLALCRRAAQRPMHTETLHLDGMNRREIRERVVMRVLELVCEVTRG